MCALHAYGRIDRDEVNAAMAKHDFTILCSASSLILNVAAGYPAVPSPTLCHKSCHKNYGEVGLPAAPEA